MVISNRVLYLLAIYLLTFNVPGTLVFGQQNSYHDSIRVILEMNHPDVADINRLNHLIHDGWNDDAGSDTFIDYAHKALGLAKGLANDSLTADAYINLVKMYITKYESSKSLEYALEAYNLYEKLNNHDKLAYTLLQLGIIYYTQNNFQKSLEYYNNAVNEYEKSGNKFYISTLFYLSAINYSRLKNFSSAHLFFNRALDLKKDLDDQRGLAECYTGVAELYIGQGMADSALRYVELASEYTSATKNTYGSAKANLILAQAWFMKGNFVKARDYALEGVRLSELVKAKELIIDSKKILHEIESSAGDFKSAYKHLVDYMALKDSVLNEKTVKNIARLEADFIIDKKQNEILLLENQSRNRNILLWASLIIGVLAISLAVLFYNKQQIRHKANQELEKAYKELELTQSQLVHQEKLASLGQLTAGIAHEIKNPLNFVNNFSQVSLELCRELPDAPTDDEWQLAVKDIMQNLELIAKHGERANSIITRMLDHSRTGTRELQKTDLNKLLVEYYNLSYQATRINHPGFFCKSSIYLDKDIPEITMVTQEISRVFLNLFNNGLYALAQKKSEDEKFEAEISITTRLNGYSAIIEIKDNGPGIPEEILGKIFQPFFTTKPAGEGTGLGLSLSYDIIHAHNGSITATNLQGGGACFTIVLPS